MDLTQRLAGKVAVITGGAGGIGLASGRRMRAEGATIVIGEIDPTAGKAAADELDGLFVPVDVSDEAAVNNLFDTAADTYGSVDIAFNNAGISPPDDDVIETTELPAWQKVQDINLKSVYLSCRAALRHRPSGGARCQSRPQLARSPASARHRHPRRPDRARSRRARARRRPAIRCSTGEADDVRCGCQRREPRRRGARSNPCNPPWICIHMCDAHDWCSSTVLLCGARTIPPCESAARRAAPRSPAASCCVSGHRTRNLTSRNTQKLNYSRCYDSHRASAQRNSSTSWAGVCARTCSSRSQRSW